MPHQSNICSFLSLGQQAELFLSLQLRPELSTDCFSDDSGAFFLAWISNLVFSVPDISISGNAELMSLLHSGGVDPELFGAVMSVDLSVEWSCWLSVAD